MKVVYIDTGYGSARVIKAKHKDIIAQIKAFIITLLGDRDIKDMTAEEHSKVETFCNKILKK